MKVLTLTHMFDYWRGRYSILSDEANLSVWVMEREWFLNRRGESCVPRGEYVLEPHNGTKYKNTYAVVGEGVGHTPEDGKARYACVFHAAVFPTQLQGCFAPAHSIGVAGAAIESREALEKLLAYFDRHIDGGIKILCQGE